MCGITGIIVKRKGTIDLVDKIRSMNRAIAHRGPDGEGYLLVSANEKPIPYSGENLANNSSFKSPYIPSEKILNACGEHSIALGHRRLSIIDLQMSGHQPMCDTTENYWIVFNGEIYNYIELREELVKKGHRFVSKSDTEVVIAAYKEWKEDCVNHFDGIWAFMIYDQEKQICFASRDRLGVKPFYYVENNDFFAFASEQKAFVRAGLIKGQTNEKQLHDYLINGRVEDEKDNFFNETKELFPGYTLTYHLKEHRFNLNRYYHLSESKANETLSENELTEKIRKALEHSIQLRMRSDVEVGTCLSGGIDSSVIAGLMNAIGKQRIHCFTSIFKSESFNEETYADEVAKSINAFHHKVEPDASSFLNDMDALIYSQDVPIWDTSTYSQFSVMKLASENKIKVVLDGQGADELFGGYHHHYIAKWKSYLLEGNYSELFRDMNDSKISIPRPYLFFAKEKIKERVNPNLKDLSRFFTSEFIRSNEVVNSVVYFDSVNKQQIHDIEKARLKSFLKCEDRCGMWHGVESRTPFSDDVNLMELMFSFNGNKKIKKGVSKSLLRNACKDLLPERIYKRYDKRGFETPMKKWMKQLYPQILEELGSIEKGILRQDLVSNIRMDDDKHMRILFKLLVYSRWKKVFST
ncbi:MAG TPA: asparagine synthase (glutamine-hydrolyzing) [Bacteroidia bacterium]|nr:asparagine synthase (glutamine-hydrolyzing) [Bacteroidia bacterium]